MQVVDSSGQIASSPTPLTVDYALKEILNNNQLWRVSHRSENHIGGYTYQLSTATANSGVDFTSIPDAVDRFLEEARQVTGIEGEDA